MPTKRSLIYNKVTYFLKFIGKFNTVFSSYVYEFYNFNKFNTLTKY